MNSQLVLETAEHIQQGSISFPEAVRKLVTYGVGCYQVDYLSKKKHFFGTDGSVVSSPIGYEGLPPVAADFDAGRLQAAILDSQRNGQHYRDFSRRAMEAGVLGYFAFLHGRRVTYLGLQGDQHTEWFPGAGPGATKD